MAEVENAAEVENSAENAVETPNMQEEINNAVTKAIADFKKQIEADKKENARLEKLSDEERQKAELENTRAELENQRLEFERERVKYEATKVLAGRGLPVEFTEYLIAGDNEKTLERIKTFEKKYNAAIEKAVNDRLKSKAPAAGNVPTLSGGVSKSFMDVIKKNQLTR